MIKANDLRIGNIVHADNSEIWTPEYNGSLVTVSIDEFQDIYFNENLYSPIYITDDLLKKMGFIWNESIKHWIITWGKNGVHFIKFDEHYNKFAFQLGKHHYRVLDYVHQLQNLFYSLTGKELEITL